MHSINVLSLSPDARNWLANSRHPRILHVFNQACNLINDRREVLSSVTPQIGNGPFNLVVEDDVLFSDHLNLQSLISVFPNQLNLGDLTIHTEDAKLWSSRPDWKMLHARRDDILKQIMSLRGAQFATKQSSRGGGDCFGRMNTTLAMTLPQLPITNCEALVSSLQPSNSLISAFANADFPSSLTAAQKLAGLGNGLTPAGDDFIIGAILAAWIIHPADVAGVLAVEVTEVAAPLTTSLSAAWLRSAGRGEAGILWHEFFDALISANPVRIREALKKILAVGETSGADALAGFIGTLMYWKVPSNVTQENDAKHFQVAT